MRWGLGRGRGRGRTLTSLPTYLDLPSFLQVSSH